MAMRGGEGTWWLPLDPFGWTDQAVSYLGSNHQSITGYGHSTNRPGHHGTVVARTVGGVATL